MFCEKCGREIPDNSSACPYCGAQMNGLQPQQMQAPGWNAQQPVQNPGWNVQQQPDLAGAAYPDTTWVGGNSALDPGNHTVQMIPGSDNDVMNQQRAQQWNQGTGQDSGSTAGQSGMVYNPKMGRWESQGQWYNEQTKQWVPIQDPAAPVNPWGDSLLGEDPLKNPAKDKEEKKKSKKKSKEAEGGGTGGTDLWPPADDQKKNKKKLFIIIGAAGGGFLLLAAALVVWLLVFGGKLPFGNTAKGQKPGIFVVEDSDGYEFVIAPEAEASVNERLNDPSRNGYYLNADRSAAMMMIDGEIWVYNGKEISKVRELTNLGTDENDNSYIVSFGTYGTDIYYVDNGSLMLYRDGQATRVSSSGVLKELQKLEYGCVTSPDGKYTAYCVPDGDGSFHSYVWDGSGTYDIGKNDIPMAISNGGKYLYYLDIGKNGKNSLYVRKGIEGTDEQSLGSSEGDIYCWFNRTATEVFFRTEDKYYLSVNGESSQKLFSAAEAESSETAGLQFVLPYGVTAYLNGTTQYAAVVDIASFKNFSVMEGDILYRIDSSGTAQRIAKHVTRSYTTADSKTVIYQDDNHNLYRINAAKAGSSAEMTVSGDCFDFVPTADGKKVFFINEEGALMCQEVGKSPVELAEMPSSTLSYNALLNGSTVIFVQEDELYLTNGEKTDNVRGLNQKTLGFAAGSGYLLVDGEEEILYTADGQKFVVVFIK